MDRFTTWDEMLRDAEQDQPCLLLDLAQYRRNLAHARAQLRPGVRARVVAKSLASLPMLDLAMEALEAIGVMSFSAEMVSAILRDRPTWEQLMGKPLPIAAVARILRDQPEAADRVIWLVDTPERVAQMRGVAEARGMPLRVALEIDIGLHRGGMPLAEMAAQIAALHRDPLFEFAGVMGYEPHLAKLPGLLRKGAARRVAEGLRQAAAQMAALGARGLVNTGGSLTFSRYGPEDGVSEVSLGSVLVKPSDFDHATTKGFAPALFIATPVLKYLPGNSAPGFERLPHKGAHLAIYGGYWKAHPVYPAGYRRSKIFGASSNQEMWAGPQLAQSPVDHFAFLRPTQSEAVIPEFGTIFTLDGAEITPWSTLSA